MFTKNKFAYILEIIKNESKIRGNKLAYIIKDELGITGDGYVRIINLMQDKGYIKYDHEANYFITKKGLSLIRKQRIVRFVAHPIVIFIIIFITLILTILSIIS